MSTETENTKVIFITEYITANMRSRYGVSIDCSDDAEYCFSSDITAGAFANGMMAGLQHAGFNVHIAHRDEFEAERANSCGAV